MSRATSEAMAKRRLVVLAVLMKGQALTKRGLAGADRCYRTQTRVRCGVRGERE